MRSNRSVAVLGASGMLGHKVCQRLRGHPVTALVRKDANEYRRFPEIFGQVEVVGNVDALRGEELEETIRHLAPGVVVNCVGVVKQLDAASDPCRIVALNALLPHRLARLCAEIGSLLIHISTDCVFEGGDGPYRESDHPDARDLYGKSKALGELSAEESFAVTLRTSFIGRELLPPRHGLLEWFLDQDGGSVDGFARVLYSGLTSIELTRVIQRVIDQPDDLTGLYHVAGEPICKHDLLVLIRERLGLDVEIRRVEKPVSDRRLVMDAFTTATGYIAPTWEEMVQEMSDDPTPYGSWPS